MECPNPERAHRAWRPDRCHTCGINSTPALSQPNDRDGELEADGLCRQCGRVWKSWELAECPGYLLSGRREPCGEPGTERNLVTLAGFDLLIRSDGTKDPEGRRSDGLPGALASELLDAYSTIATDQNGIPFAAEVEAALDLLGVEEPGTRADIRSLWRSYGQVLAHERERLMPEMDDK